MACVTSFCAISNRNLQCLVVFFKAEKYKTWISIEISEVIIDFPHGILRIKIVAWKTFSCFDIFNKKNVVSIHVGGRMLQFEQQDIIN